MTITNGYLTTAEARTYAGLSDLADTELLDDVVTAVSRAIDNACQRCFFQHTAEARTFPTQSATTLTLGAFNDLVSVTSLKFDRDGDGTFEETLSASNYGLLPPSGGGFPEAGPYTVVELYNQTLFPIPGGTAGTGRKMLTQITGTWGWPAVPAQVKQACRLQVARVMKRQESPLGVAGFGEFGVVRVSRLDPDIDAMLQPYKLLSPGLA
jgi:hypothetical protein